MKTEADCSTKGRSGRRVLLALAVLFAAPSVLSACLYLSGWRPTANAAHGELVRPPQQIGNLDLGEEGGERISLDSLGKRWTLVYFGAAACGVDCMRSLYFMRQVHAAQGREQERVQRVFVARGELEPAGMATLTRLFPGLKVVVASPDAERRWPGGASREGVILLVDPIGNLVMRYGVDADPGGMRKDLSRLLAYSWVG